MALFTRILGRRPFRLADFAIEALEFDQLGVLILDQPAEPQPLPPNVVALPRPTAGELRQSIERHLQAKHGSAPIGDEISPADELKSALAELRQSLR